MGDANPGIDVTNYTLLVTFSIIRHIHNDSQVSRTEKPSVQKLLRTAKSLFFRFGIRKVSVVEICMEAGVSKMTFYRHFKNRDDIAIQVLGNYFTKRMETFELIFRENIQFEK